MKTSAIDGLAMLSLWLITPAAYFWLGQDCNWDLRNYHLYNTISFLHLSFAGDTAPAGIQSYFNPLVSLPAYFIHYSSTSVAEAFWMGLGLASFQGLIGPLTYRIARLLLGTHPWICLLAAAFGVTSPIVIAEAGSSWADLSLGVLQLGSVALILLSQSEREQLQMEVILACAWGLFGASCGLKFTCIFLLPLLLLLSLYALIKNLAFRPGWKSITILILLRSALLPFCLSFVAFGYFWMARSWKENGNPFFPLFSSIFGESRIFQLKGNDIDPRFFARSLRSLITAPKAEFGHETLRLDHPYRDLRTSLWVYPLMATLGFAAFSILKPEGPENSERSKETPLEFNRFTLLLIFQLGLLIIYFVWLWVAGYARYTVAVQCLSGVSLVASLLMALYLLRRYHQSEVTMEKIQGGHRQFIAALLMALLTVCLLTQSLPPFDRVTFTSKWNSLRLVEGSSADLTSPAPARDENPFQDGKPILLMSKPLGWLKQYASRNQGMHLVNEGFPYPFRGRDSSPRTSTRLNP